MMILAVAQPRFPTNHPDIRQETYCPVVVLVWTSVSLQIKRKVIQTIYLTIRTLFRDIIIRDASVSGYVILESTNNVMETDISSVQGCPSLFEKKVSSMMTLAYKSVVPILI